MSTTVKTCWLNDNNGDKIAPKTLSSQVITSDGDTLEKFINDTIPLHNMNGCIVCNGEEITLTVGKDIEAGQVLAFKYKFVDGYEVGWTAPLEVCIPLSVSPVMGSAKEYGEDSVTIDGTKTSYTFTGCYFVAIKAVSDTVTEKFVDLTSDQTVSGVKTFSNGINIGDAVIAYDATAGALKITFPETTTVEEGE